MKKTAQIPADILACVIILAEWEAGEIEKQCVCFVVAGEVLVLHRLTWEIKTLLEDGISRQLSSGICWLFPCLQTKLVKKLFANLLQKN